MVIILYCIQMLQYISVSLYKQLIAAWIINA